MRLLVFCNLGGIFITWAILGYWMVVAKITKNPHFIPGFVAENIEKIGKGLIPIFPFALVGWLAVFTILYVLFRVFAKFSSDDRIYVSTILSLSAITVASIAYFY